MQDNNIHTPSPYKPDQPMLRFLMAFTLTLVAIFISTTSFYLLRYEELKKFETEYDAVARQLMASMEERLLKMLSAMDHAAATYERTYPDPSAWPMVISYDWRTMARSLSYISSLEAMAVVPILTPDRLTEFEEYVRNGFREDPELSPEAIAHVLERGVFAYSSPDRQKWYHDTVGQAPRNHPNPYLTPMLHTSAGAQYYIALLSNGHANPGHALAQDNIIDCVNGTLRKWNDAPSDGPIFESVRSILRSCRGETDVIMQHQYLYNERVFEVGFNSALYAPVVLENRDDDMRLLPSSNTFDHTSRVRLVGFITAFLPWKKVLQLVVPGHISGLYVLLETPARVGTFAVSDGHVSTLGLGELHDEAFESMMVQKQLFDEHNHLKFKLRIYPSESFKNKHMTNVPMLASICALFIMLLTYLVFRFYDRVLRDEIISAQTMLETRRNFVRFISHEVRTPLNSVRLGLQLVIGEIKEMNTSLGLDNRATCTSSTLTLDTEGESERDRNRQSQREQMKYWVSMLNDLNSSNDVAVRVLDDILNYDKVVSGSLALEFGVVDVSNLLRNTTKLFELSATQKGIELLLQDFRDDEVTSAGGVCFMLGDMHRFCQVLRNFLSNAIKFTPHGGRVLIKGERVKEGLPDATIKVDPVEFDVSTMTRGGSVRLTVVDSGVGMTEAELGTVFDDGVQFNPGKLQAGGGSGLGLFISRGIVEQHGGRVWATSKGKGHGCGFHVEVPVFLDGTGKMLKRVHSATRDLSSDPSVSGSASESMPSGVDSMTIAGDVSSAMSATIGKRRILLVDDTASNRKILRRILSKRGHECDEAEHGLDAVEKYIAARKAMNVVTLSNLPEEGLREECNGEGASGMLLQSNRGSKDGVCLTPKTLGLEESEPFDTILMDFEMPVMKGPDATKELREAGCSCLIIGVTGNCLAQDVSHFKACGANKVLPKPLNVEDLEEIWSKYETSRKYNESLDHQRSR